MKNLIYYFLLISMTVLFYTGCKTSPDLFPNAMLKLENAKNAIQQAKNTYAYSSTIQDLNTTYDKAKLLYDNAFIESKKNFFSRNNEKISSLLDSTGYYSNKVITVCNNTFKLSGRLVDDKKNPCIGKSLSLHAIEKEGDKLKMIFAIFDDDNSGNVLAPHAETDSTGNFLFKIHKSLVTKHNEYMLTSFSIFIKEGENPLLIKFDAKADSGSIDVGAIVYSLSNPFMIDMQ
jgi:hypothetical protein